MFFFSSRRRHTRSKRDWSSDVCSSDLIGTWAKVALGVLVGIGIAPGVWPYSHGCGLRLIFYLLGVTTVRSEERRVGKECRSRRSLYHKKKKSIKKEVLTRRRCDYN